MPVLEAKPAPHASRQPSLGSPLLKHPLSVCALLALGGAASAQNFGPRGPGEHLNPAERRERRQEFREERRDADRSDGPSRRDRADRPDRGGDVERRDRFDRADRGERFEERRDRRDRVGGRIVVRENVRPGFVVTEPFRPTRVVCRLVQERRFNPATSVLRVRPVRECSRFVGRRRVVVSCRVVG